MTYREATLADVPSLVEMGQRFVEESPYKRFVGENQEQMRALVEQVVALPNGRVLVAEEAGTLVGMIAVIAKEHFITGEIIGGELVWWVNPEQRPRGVGIQLLKMAEQAARDLGAKHMQMIAPDERVGNLYKRRGYELVEVTYQRRL